MSRVSVQTRLLVATVLPSLALLLTYLVGLPAWSLYVEDRVLVNIVASTLASAEDAAGKGRDASVLPGEITVYRGEAQLPAPLGSVVQGLEPGVHEQENYEREGRVTDLFIGIGAGSDPSDRVVVVLDAEGLESLDIRPSTVLSLLTVSASSLCLLVGGIALSRSVSRSVRALSALTRSEHAAARPILPDDELGDLGRAWLRSRGELQQAADRQRRFARNVSHELRTPIAVVSGAIELMRRHRPERDEREHRLLCRAEDALGGMRELVEIFMGVAEGATAGDRGQCPLGEVVAEVVATIASTQDLPDGKLSTTVVGGRSSPVPRVSMAIVVRHIVLNALRHAPADATIEIVVEDGVVRVCNAVRRNDSEDPPRRGGVGLEILHELVRSVGWSVSARLDGDQFVTTVATDGRFNDLSS